MKGATFNGGGGLLKPFYMTLTQLIQNLKTIIVPFVVDFQLVLFLHKLTKKVGAKKWLF